VPSNQFPGFSSVRDIAAVQNTLYVADPDENDISILSTGGQFQGTLSKKGALGVVVVQDLLISTSGNDSGHMHAFNISQNLASVWKSSITIAHGAGMGVDEDNRLIYVVEQDTNSILIFDLDSGEYQSKFAGTPDRPEQLLFVKCQ
jgi:DNA-binding beta-propeller fold protein YncE